MFFKNELLEILKELSEYNDFSHFGYKAYDNIVDYLPFFRNKFKEKGLGFVKAKDIIRQLQKIYEDKDTLPAIKLVIEKIFSKMEPRDQNYRWFNKCNCASCQFFKNVSEVNDCEFIELFKNALEEEENLKKLIN